MNKIQVANIENFWEAYDSKLEKGNHIVISDIDSVWFGGVFDPRSYISRFSTRRLYLMKKFQETTDFMLFTNRNLLGRWKGGYVDQVKANFSNVKVFNTSEEFLEKPDLNGFNLITNAQKPSPYSFEVLELALKRYTKVYYIAGREFPWTYKDEVLLKNLEEKEKELSEKVTFIDISK